MFKNVLIHLKLQKEVTKAQTIGNFDTPEGGFDAVMQAIVCKKDIGWREQARHLLIYASDAWPHYAGDGKMGGIITPNDGKCHLNGNMYTHSTFQDYPSITQINRKVKENAINIIFAVTSDVRRLYKEISKLVEGSSSAVLSGDSSNVVELVRDEYNVSKFSSYIIRWLFYHH